MLEVPEDPSVEEENTEEGKDSRKGEEEEKDNRKGEKGMDKRKGKEENISSCISPGLPQQYSWHHRDEKGQISADLQI